MGARDVFQAVDELDPATVEAIGQRLEFRGADPRFNAMREEYFDRLSLGSAALVVDLGCGTGVEVRALLRRPEFDGRVIAIDRSAALLERAVRLAGEEGLAGRVEFRLGDAHRPDIPDGAADAVIAHTVLSHVREPRTVLAEMARMARPGGAVAVFDGDYAGWAWFHPDPALEAAVNAAMLATAVTHARICRELPRLLREAGLELVHARAHAYAEAGAGRFFLAAAETYAPLLTAAGAVPGPAVERWLADQRQAAAEGTFFASCNYCAFVARAPLRDAV